MHPIIPTNTQIQPPNFKFHLLKFSTGLQRVWASMELKLVLVLSDALLVVVVVVVVVVVHMYIFQC